MVESYCGFDCAKCPVYIASHTNDINDKKSILEKYHMNENVYCDGCESKNCEDSICGTCKIRKCASSKNIKNCGWCKVYPNCENIAYIYNTNVNSRTYLDSENKRMKNGM